MLTLRHVGFVTEDSDGYFVLHFGFQSHHHCPSDVERGLGLV